MALSQNSRLLNIDIPLTCVLIEFPVNIGACPQNIFSEKHFLHLLFVFNNKNSERLCIFSAAVFFLKNFSFEACLSVHIDECCCEYAEKLLNPAESAAN